jgi:hypothetical protein
LSLVQSSVKWPDPSVPDNVSFSYEFDFGTLGILAAIGLWFLFRAGRTMALLLTWYWLLGSAFLFFKLFPVTIGGLSFTATIGDYLTNIPQNILRACVVPFFLIQVWQLHTLKRPHIRALFGLPVAEPSPEPKPSSPLA